MKHKRLTAIEQRHLKKVRRKLREYEQVVLRSGFVATRAEVEWAKEEIANSPYDTYRSIEEAIVVKRGLDQYERGEYTLSSQYANNYFVMVSNKNFSKKIIILGEKIKICLI